MLASSIAEAMIQAAADLQDAYIGIGQLILFTITHRQ